MRMRIRIRILAMSVAALGMPHWCWADDSQVLSLKRVIELTEKVSHSLSAAQLRESATADSIGIAKSSYYPTLNFEAIDSTGFSGSNSLLGIGGLMGSPYRSGVSAGLVAKATLWDFGRTRSSVQAAKFENEAQKQTTQLTLFDVDSDAARIFYDCVKFRTQSEAWTYVLEQAKQVATEVKQFIATGQRSVVERYLAESQVEEALTSQADSVERMRLTLHRLSLLTALEEGGLSCPNFEMLQSKILEFSERDSKHPLVAVAEEEAKAAEARLTHAETGHLPLLVAVGSLGEMERSRVVPKQDYAVGVGLTIPLFDGLKTTGEVKRARALLIEKEFLVQAAHEQVDQINAKLDEIIQSSAERLIHLGKELALAEEGFGVAKKRYFSFQGSLVDVRESLRNLTRARILTNDAHIENLQATTAKYLYNGKRNALIETQSLQEK